MPTQRVCFATIVSDTYIDMARVLISSILRHNPWFALPFRVIYNRSWAPLSKANQELLTAIYPKTEFVHVNNGPYKDINAKAATKCFAKQSTLRTDPEKGAKTWFLKFGMCLWSDYDRIIYIDSDMLCTGSLRHLVNKDMGHFAVVVNKRRGGKFISYEGSRINAGTLILGKKMLTQEVHDSLIKCADGHKNGDQGAWRKYMKGKSVYALNAKNNKPPAAIKYKNNRFVGVNGCCLIHFFGAKPYEKKVLNAADKFWFNHLGALNVRS